MYRSYSLESQPAEERLEYFRSVVDQVFCPMHVTRRQPAAVPFTGCVDAAHLRGMQIARVASGPCVVQRRVEDIARMSSAPYLVKFQMKGDSVWSQRDRTTHLRPGDFVVCTTSEPYVLELRTEYEMPVIVIDGDAMRRLTPDPDQFLGARMSGGDVDCGLLSSFVAQVVARIGRLPAPMICRAEATVIDLLGVVLASRATQANPSPEQLRAGIKAYIRAHLHQRDLGPTMIARAFGVSARYVHSLFKSEPLTVGRYIRSLRVHACRRTLQSRSHARMSLTDVALRWGFYDLSQMSRCFREEFGATPGEVRMSSPTHE